MVTVQLQSDIFVTNIIENPDMSDDTVLQPNHLPNGSTPDLDDDVFFLIF
jgi:hypothetical protein